MKRDLLQYPRRVWGQGGADLHRRENRTSLWMHVPGDYGGQHGERRMSEGPDGDIVAEALTSVFRGGNETQNSRKEKVP